MKGDTLTRPASRVQPCGTLPDQPGPCVCSVLQGPLPTFRPPVSSSASPTCGARSTNGARRSWVSSRRLWPDHGRPSPSRVPILRLASGTARAVPSLAPSPGYRRRSDDKRWPSANRLHSVCRLEAHRTRPAPGHRRTTRQTPESLSPEDRAHALARKDHGV